MNVNSENTNYPAKLQTFNNPDRYTQGWYWVMASAKLRVGELKPITILGRKLAIYRGKNRLPVIVDAYCPHMGAHLAQGKIEGNELRCFFHQWKFDGAGICVDIPDLDQPPQVKARTWPTAENYGMIWVWTGEVPQHLLSFTLDWDHQLYDVMFGNHAVINCHPHVLMINAIDTQYFNTIHPPLSQVRFEKEEINNHAIIFNNITCSEKFSPLIKLIRYLYKSSPTYSVCYWYGSTVIVTLGFNSRQIHIMLATRLIEFGQAEIQICYIIKKGKGLWNFLSNRILLWLTKIWTTSFIDTNLQVFPAIRFDLQNPLDDDQPIIEFINHLEQQKPLNWQNWNLARSREPETPKIRDKSRDELIND